MDIGRAIEECFREELWRTMERGKGDTAIGTPLGRRWGFTAFRPAAFAASFQLPPLDPLLVVCGSDKPTFPSSPTATKSSYQPPSSPSS